MFKFIILSCLLLICNAFYYSKIPTMSRSSLYMGPTIYGAQQTRSPLVNWYLIEQNIPFTQKPPRPSPHPFGQSPFFTDDGGVEIFESGAILLYLADKYVSKDAVERASYTKWVVWANSEFEELCFGPGFSGPLIDRTDKKAVNVLEEILGRQDYLVGNKFSVADVAVASYLCYIPIFFPRANLSKRPNIVKYMEKAAERKAFVDAFGADHAEQVKRKTAEWSNKKAFGIF